MANSESWTLLKTISSDLSDLTVSLDRRGSRPRRCGRTLILVDIASPTAADGRPLVNAVRWLSDRAVEAGGLLDLSATVSVRTPGHPEAGYLAGWHLCTGPTPATLCTRGR